MYYVPYIILTGSRLFVVRDSLKGPFFAEMSPKIFQGHIWW